jgi:mannose-6-phosphate isomerase-like protein (cupin superfamily)
MHKVIRSGELEPSASGTVTFVGEEHGSGVSFFLVDNVPGAGPDLHVHPYSETWIVHRGRARFTADGVDVEAGPGDMLVVGAHTPHKFKNVGDGRLDVICIHASPRIIQDAVEE